MKNELKHIKDKSRIFFLAQAWNQGDIKELMDLGIKNFVVDNEYDLNELLNFLDKINCKINLLLRIKLKENTIKTEKYFVFGLDSDIVNKKIKELRKNDKIEKLGIHFHRKTQNMSEWNLKYEILDIIDKDVLKLIDIINIGGGLPSDYANTNVDVLPTILNKIKEFKKWVNENKIKLIIEPGRFIAAPAGKLITQIIGIYENNIIVNCSVYNADMDALIVPVKLLVEGETNEKNGIPYVIKGITPCSMDLFRYRVYLKKPQIGQEIVFLNSGAYNFSTDFCDLDKLSTEIIEKFD
jgi:ornithine decarboxylase